jgi:crotonobetainyl-CoA:carnitine CoA-transferase CaiB-like acyl-CoA transferase
MPGPFAGLRVVDVTSVVVGPYTSQLLGDMGADVIKIESPEGDLTRLSGPSRNPGMTSNYMQINRNKRSMGLDLKAPEAAEALRKLIRTADVFVHNMRPEPLERLGFDYARVRGLKPDIVYCNIWGFGREGRYAGRPAFDDIIQGASGLVALEAFGGKPARYMPMLIADKTTGLFAAYAIASALFHRLQSGKGQEIEVPMFESMVSFTMMEHLWGESFRPAKGPTGSARHATPSRWPFETKDGHICCIASSNKHWAALLKIADREDLWDNPVLKDRNSRFGNREAVVAILEELMITRTTAEWAESLGAAGVPCMPILSLDDVVADPHLADVGFWHEATHPTEGEIRLMNPPYGLAETPPEIHRPPPRFAEHTREVLGELGYDTGEIDKLFEAGAALTPSDEGEA